MSIQDPISDLLIILKNGYLSKKDYIIIYSSKIKLKIISILKEHFFIEDFIIIDKKSKKPKLKIFLKYYKNKVPMIKKVKRVSKVSSRVYIKKNKIPKVINGFGIAIISTSSGILTDKEAKKLNIGGEILCTIE